MANPGATGSIRLDKLLWYLRFARSRSLAQAMIAAGHIRLDGRRMTRASAAVHPGQTLVLPLGERIEVLRLLAIPGRRGPSREAQACYRRIDADTGPAGNCSISPDGKAVPPNGADGPME